MKEYKYGSVSIPNGATDTPLFLTIFGASPLGDLIGGINDINASYNGDLIFKINSTAADAINLTGVRSFASADLKSELATKDSLQEIYVSNSSGAAVVIKIVLYGNNGSGRKLSLDFSDSIATGGGAATEATLLGVKADTALIETNTNNIAIDTALSGNKLSNIDTSTNLTSNATGSISDIVYVSGNGTIISILKGIFSKIVDFLTYIGALTETAPSTDTASSGLNGRLQRIAQRLSDLLVFGIHDNNNSTSVNLGSGATFTGVDTNIIDYSAINVMLQTDQNGTLYIEYSSIALGAYHSEAIPINVSTPGTTEVFTYGLMVEGEYYRIRFVNGATANTNFKITSTLKRNVGTSEITPIKNIINDDSDALVTKGVIYGKTTGGGGGYVAVKVNPSGALTVENTPVAPSAILPLATQSVADIVINEAITSGNNSAGTVTTPATGGRNISVTNNSGIVLNITSGGTSGGADGTKLLSVLPGDSLSVPYYLLNGLVIRVKPVSGNLTVTDYVRVLIS